MTAVTTEGGSSDLTFREARDEDLPSVLALWDLAGWGPITLGDFRRRYLEGPLRPAFVRVTEARGGRIVGTSLIDFKQALLLGDVKTVIRGHAQVLVPELRRGQHGTREIDESHPAVRASIWAEDLINGWDVAASYGLPNPLFQRWPRFGERPQASTDFGCLQFKPAAVPAGEAPLAVQRVSGFHAEYDRLWTKAVRGLGIECAVVRDSRWLNHLRAGSLKLECRTLGSAELVGYATLWDHDNGKLTDILAVDPDAMAAVVRSVACWVRDETGQHRMRRISALDHPLYSPALRENGAGSVEWAFRLNVGAGRTDAALGPEHDPERWYVTAGD